MRGSLSHYANQAVKEIFMKIIMLENVGCYKALPTPGPDPLQLYIKCSKKSGMPVEHG